MNKREIQVSLKQIEMMRHAHGADSKEAGYRSHYCIQLDDPDMVDMVEKGLFSKPIGMGMVGENCGIFHITEKGIKFCK